MLVNLTPCEQFRTVAQAHLRVLRRSGHYGLGCVHEFAARIAARIVSPDYELIH